MGLVDRGVVCCVWKGERGCLLACFVDKVEGGRCRNGRMNVCMASVVILALS